MPSCCAGSPTRRTTRRGDGTDLLRVFLLGEIPAHDARKYVTTFVEHAQSELKRFA